MKFNVGEIVKFSEKYCGPGEEFYIHMVKESFDDSNKVLIVTLNTMLTLGSSEWVTEDMIQKAGKFEVIVYHTPSLETKYLVADTESKKIFAGYDFMGSVDWVDSMSEAVAMDLDEAEQIKNDLFAAE